MASGSEFQRDTFFVPHPKQHLKPCKGKQNRGPWPREDFRSNHGDESSLWRCTCLHLVPLTSIFFSSQHMDKVSFLDKVALHISVGSKKKRQCYCISVTALRKWCWVWQRVTAANSRNSGARKTGGRGVDHMGKRNIDYFVLIFVVVSLIFIF